MAWLGTPPIPIPDDLFGPIYDINSGLITVEGDVPAAVGNGVYVWQTDSAGNLYSKDMDVSREYASLLTGNYPIDDTLLAFNGDITNWANCFDGNYNATPSKGYYEMVLDLSFNPLDGPVDVYSVMSPTPMYYGRFAVDTGSGYGSDIECKQNAWTSLIPLGSKLHKLRVRTTHNGCSFAALRANGKICLDPSLSANARVNSVTGSSLVTVPNNESLFMVGKYLRTFDQKVAPWVYEISRR